MTSPLQDAARGASLLALAASDEALKDGVRCELALQLQLRALDEASRERAKGLRDAISANAEIYTQLTGGEMPW